MDDLSGLDWSTTSDPNVYKKPTSVRNYAQPLRQPSPPTLASTHVSGSVGISVPAPKVPTTDSFSNLISFGSSKQVTLTLQEQQKKLQAEKAAREAEKKRQYEAQFGNSQFWDGLGAQSLAKNPSPQTTSRISTPGTQTESRGLYGSARKANEGDASANSNDDLFTAFNADTKVNNSSHYPPPANLPTTKIGSLKSQPLDLINSNAWTSDVTASSGQLGDDDPFGIEQVKVQGQDNYSPADNDHDDLLGDLAKPVEEVKRKIRLTSSVEAPQQEQQETNEVSEDPWDEALNNLVDMGFSLEKSRQALVQSGAGLDVQVAVGWLLNDAHRQAKEKVHQRSELLPDRDSGPSSGSIQRQKSTDRSHREAIPAWMRQDNNNPQPCSRDGSRSPAHDVDLSKTAAAVGSNIIKTASSIWKSSQKKVQQAVAEFSQDSDPSQPKWMRSASHERRMSSKKPYNLENEDHNKGKQRAISTNVSSITDEAMLLEIDSRPSARRIKPSADPRFFATASTASHDQSPVSSNPSLGRSTTPLLLHSELAANMDSRSRLSKQAVEEQSSQAYVSPARRKKITSLKMGAEPELLLGVSNLVNQPFDDTSPQKSQAIENKLQPPKTYKPSVPIPLRPEAPLRTVPTLSASVLTASTKNRMAGTEHFKRGDYISANSYYSLSLSELPPSHPITIVLLCNRSLTALKTGDPKSAVADADAALNLIGPGRGEGELVDLEDGSDGCKKPMNEFWCKALMRKAEALEQMERWKDAGTVWKEAIEAGVGGAISAQGRRRCERALAPKPMTKGASKTSNTLPKPRAAALTNLSPLSAKGTEALNRLREANIAAEKADDEKFALSDSIDARISKWREGRKDNLRALLCGMDQVLWEGSGWKKVGMHELVINGKVKVIYMKAISKVHPDKVNPLLYPLIQLHARAEDDSC
jgi:hypothetical protein